MLEYKPYYLKPYLKSSHYKTYNMLEYKPYYLKPYLKSSHYKTWFHQQLFSFSTDRKYKEYMTSIHSQKISFKKHIWSTKCILRLIKWIIRVLSGCVVVELSHKKLMSLTPIVRCIWFTLTCLYPMVGRWFPPQWSTKHNRQQDLHKIIRYSVRVYSSCSTSGTCHVTAIS